MVRGLDRFRSVFAAHPDAFVLIGGTACHLAMAQVGSTFRTTHDFDKARAWLDLTDRRTAGEAIDSADIRKHRNDCLRLVALIPGDSPVPLPPSVRSDLERFMDAMNTADIQPKALGAWRRSTGRPDRRHAADLSGLKQFPLPRPRHLCPLPRGGDRSINQRVTR